MKSYLVILSLSLLLAGAGAASGADLLTHMDVGPNDLVVLQGSNAVEAMSLDCNQEPRSMPTGFYRQYPDGTVSPDRFRIPEGAYLVITDVDWVYRGQVQGAGETRTLEIFRENMSFTQRSEAFRAAMVLDRNGIGANTEAMTSGFVVSSEARICVDVGPHLTGQDQEVLHPVILRGYLLGRPNLTIPIPPIPIPGEPK